jgi:hypothetical protein
MRTHHVAILKCKVNWKIFQIFKNEKEKVVLYVILNYQKLSYFTFNLPKWNPTFFFLSGNCGAVMRVPTCTYQLKNKRLFPPTL